MDRGDEDVVEGTDEDVRISGPPKPRFSSVAVSFGTNVSQAVPCDRQLIPAPDLASG